jgi:hypothetical protein
MKAGPKVGEEGMTETDGPIRTSGTTPAQQSTAQDDPKRREEEG